MRSANNPWISIIFLGGVISWLESNADYYPLLWHGSLCRVICNYLLPHNFINSKPMGDNLIVYCISKHDSLFRWSVNVNWEKSVWGKMKHTLCISQYTHAGKRYLHIHPSYLIKQLQRHSIASFKLGPNIGPCGTPWYRIMDDGFNRSPNLNSYKSKIDPSSQKSEDDSVMSWLMGYRFGTNSVADLFDCLRYFYISGLTKLKYVFPVKPTRSTRKATIN